MGTRGGYIGAGREGGRKGIDRADGIGGFSRRRRRRGRKALCGCACAVGCEHVLCDRGGSDRTVVAASWRRTTQQEISDRPSWGVSLACGTPRKCGSISFLIQLVIGTRLGARRKQRRWKYIVNMTVHTYVRVHEVYIKIYTHWVQ
jgi:hypothetical protein